MLQLPTPGELKAQRARLGLTQQALADAAGISQSMVARIEGGKVDPSYSTVQALVRALNQAEQQAVSLVELMTAPVVSVAPGDKVAEAVARMQADGYSQLPVLQDGTPVGSMSDQDVVRALSGKRPEELRERPVDAVMGPPFPAVAPEASPDDVLSLLEARPAVLVMEQGRVIGLVTKSDLLDAIGG